MKKIKRILSMTGNGETEFGRYSHRYSGGFHRISFYANDSKRMNIVFNGAAYPTWDVDAEIEAKKHHAMMLLNSKR